MRCYVLMGVSGCGKSAVGAALSNLCDLEFVDGDDLHPPANIQKMSQGKALNDDDRLPWLTDIGRTLAGTSGPVAIGCSALKRKYRDLIRDEVAEPVCFLHLAASKQVLTARVAERSGHFMPKSLLDSQFAALEPLQADETGYVLDIDRPLNAVVEQAKKYVDDYSD